MRLTVGPLPPAVYWRRRALVLGAALVVMFLIAQACMASASPGDRAGGGPSPDTTASPGATTAPAPPPPPPPATATARPATEPDGDGGEEPDPQPGGADLGPDGCSDDEIRVIARASETTFRVGQQVQFTIQIEHAADRSCRRDVGGDHRELYLVRDAGAGHVWSSQDCANPTGTEVVELTGGWEREHHIGFTGQETSKCTGLAAAGPDLEPGRYELWARLGTARSEPVTITLT